MDRSSAKIPFHINSNAPESLYLQFKEQLKAHICSQKLPPGSRLPGIKTLARLAGVSVKTANSGLNELLRERVCVRHPKKGTFVAGGPSPAQQCRRKKVCMLYHRNPANVLNHDDVRVHLLQGIQTGCREHGVDLLFFSGDPVETIEIYRNNDRIEITGVLMLEASGFEEDIRVAQIYPQLRFIYFNDYAFSFEKTPRNVYGIFHDDFSGGYQAGIQMAALRPSSFTLIGVKLPIETYRKRAAGFRMALTENGYDPEVQLSEYWENGPIRTLNDLRGIGYQTAGRLLKAAAPLSAVFVLNDVIAEGVWERFREADRLESLLLFGYDNIFPEISRDRHFSTIDINFRKMGQCAVELITASTFIPKAVFLPPQMLCRINYLTKGIHV